MKTLKSYAKINLFLEIIQKDKTTGYHFLSTLICSLKDYYDIITIENSNNFSVSLSGKYIFEGDNLLDKTIKIFKENFSGNTNFKVNIEKNIKFGAGLGGGSSNAGVFLRFLLEENGISLTESEFAKVATKIGADVPYFYNNLPKMCSGYGEILQKPDFTLPSPLYAIVVLPPFFISTPSIFKKIIPESYKGTPSSPITFNEALKIENDLERYAIESANGIADVLSSLTALPNILKVALSGSGSTCFALFNTYELAQEAKAAYKESHETFISEVIT